MVWRLQWSHVLTNVERPFDRSERRFDASWLQWSHVLTNVESDNDSGVVQKSISFNGATSSRTWKETRPDAKVILIESASMEPRPHERGKWLLDKHSFAGCLLQWSHVLTNVESTPVQTETAQAAWASMEPRPHERGKLRALSRVVKAKPASMEPRPHERGKLRILEVLKGARPGFNGATSSRTWKAASSGVRAALRFGFNGATSSRTWKGGLLEQKFV